MHRILVRAVSRDLLEFSGHFAMQIPVHFRLGFVGNIHADLRFCTFRNQFAGNSGIGNQILLILMRAPHHHMSLLNRRGKRLDIRFEIARILHDMVERGLRGNREILVRLLRSHARIHVMQQRLGSIRTIQRRTVRHGNATGHRQHVLQEQRINGDHTINRNAILASPHGAHNLAGARKIRREIHVANILAKLVGKQQTFLGGQIHNRLIGILNFRIGNERLQAHVTTLHRDQAERSRKTAGRTRLRIRLRKDQIIARSIIRMAFRAQHAGQHLHDGIQGMHHAVKFFAIRFRGFQGVRDLRDMRGFHGFHGFHFPRGLVDRIVRDLERLLRRFQSGNFDRAVFHVNTVQINIFGDFHQLRQRLRRNILHGGHRGAYGGNVIAHIRHDRRHLPQRRRGLLVGLAYVIGERGCLLLKLGRVRFGDGLLQALST